MLLPDRNLCLAGSVTYPILEEPSGDRDALLFDIALAVCAWLCRTLFIFFQLYNKI